MSFEPDDPSSLRGDIGAYSNLIRTVTCTEGEVDVVQELKIRFEYGAMVPWGRKDHDADGVSVLTALAGGDALALHGPELSAGDRTHLGRHDRKSTRLNSSHVAISYAVFC